MPNVARSFTLKKYLNFLYSSLSQYMCFELFHIRIEQMSFSPALHTCESEELKQREEGQHHDFLHEIITHYKSKQLNTWLRRKMIVKRDVTCCRFDQKPSSAQLNNLEQHPPFT